MTEQELKAEVMSKICQAESFISMPIDITDQIHNLYKQAGYVKLSDDQSLPEIPEIMTDSLGYMKFIKGEPVQRIYVEAQHEMLSANFRKVEL